MHSKISILGSGAWGTTLAWLLSSKGEPLSLWSRNPEKFKSQAKQELPDSVLVTNDLKQCLDQTNLIIFACTSQSLREVAKACNQIDFKSSHPILVSAVKGLELGSAKRMSEVLGEELPDFNISALSGPNLASEILDGKPAAAVIACVKQEVADKVRLTLNSAKFRLYTNNDLIGVELGGAFKNVIAIGAGVSDGLDLGVNAKAALLTRGLAEMTKLARHMGAASSTLYGLSGLGDLITTSNSPLSRNYRFGLALGKGERFEAALNSVGGVVEGVPTTQAVCELSKRLELELPIAQQLKSTLDGLQSPRDSIKSLMTRPLTSEW